MIPLFSIIVTLALPSFVLHRTRVNRPLRRPYLFSIGSFFFCALAMLEELLTIKRRLFAGDICGIEDTIGAVIMICIVVLVTAVILNLAALGISYESD